MLDTPLTRPVARHSSSPDDKTFAHRLVGTEITDAVRKRKHKSMGLRTPYHRKARLKDQSFSSYPGGRFGKVSPWNKMEEEKKKAYFNSYKRLKLQFKVLEHGFLGE